MKKIVICLIVSILILTTSGSVQLAASTDNIEGYIAGENGKNYKVVACVIRQSTAGDGWKIITTPGHSSMNVLSVSNDSESIYVNYNFTVKNVISFVAVPDETFGQAGYIFGSSVALDKATIYISRPSTNVSGLAMYDGTSWQTYNSKGNLAVESYTNGALKLTHDSMGGTTPVSVEAIDSPYLARVKYSATHYTTIEFTDYDGNVITTPDTGMKLTLHRTPLNYFVSPQDLKSDTGNIWCLGVFEVE